MKKLFLFDIDSTLITSVRSTRFVDTVNRVHSLNVSSDRNFSGYTDVLIMTALLKDVGMDAQQIKESMPRMLAELDKIHKETFHVKNMRILPGVSKMLESLRKTDNILGLATGNLETVAKRKLEALGIWGYFRVGGFGSDPHETRGEVVAHAIKKAGFSKKLKQVYVIGDTPRDVEAASQAGVRNSVAVSNGFLSVKELKASGARAVLKDFTDLSAVLKVLDIG